MAARDIFDGLTGSGWNLVQEWINTQRAESQNLDFKGRRPQAPPSDLETADKDVLGKAMSGMANIDGGVLVFGLDTNKAAKGDPNRLSPNQLNLLADADAFKRAVQRHYRDVTTPTVPGISIEAIVDPGAPPRGIVAGTAREPIVRLDTDSQGQLIEFTLTKHKNRSSERVFTVLEPDIVKTFYPGFEEYLGHATVRRTADQKPRTLRLRGTIFAIEAQPVDFDEELTFAREETVILPRAPVAGTRL